ncbi:MAG: Crp/Fnr family transcriptional regulator [Bacteroidales bacterium]|jgi:CRP-like cAMP-binding protein|nr:Crp/Fnr family transcriptional regulator [Bacteroidales bacterium]MDD2264866.1 Crp/Fnr family transcriptional regulator [Bacteroidales bacterium]MDD2831942.1 Crp/Fnr family transcriptional regulator [Bacteroidales bacterium]MDD3698012.1 Crp/Fnr family transcriptional regulator [Bacteroidales bacterium]MDD4473553.1 Crp/Fnr family transcriptional regulator [Bacteroidales bacterium]
MQVKQNIPEYYGLSEEEVRMTLESYVEEHYKAGEYFLQEGKIAGKIGFVKKGIFRSFFYNDNTDDITTQFYVPGSLIISIESLNNQVPSKENIVAVVDSELSTVSYERQKQLYELIPAWNRICKDLGDEMNKDMLNRATQLQTMSATERYQDFCTQNPEIIKNVALKHIASYLGIDIATLSRIRRKI